MRLLAPSSLAAILAATALTAQEAPAVKTPVVKVIQGSEPTQNYQDCRRMLVGPGVNQPDPFPGYTGFVGWEAPIRLRSGTWLVGFNAGYWHGSPPTPLTLSPENLAQLTQIGMPTDVDAPTGGRAMLIRSTDEGVTWSKPETIIDTHWDDRHPNFCELADGTILCTFFTYPGTDASDLTRAPAKTCLAGVIRSLDGGNTWEQTPRRPPSPFATDATDGPIIELQDGSALVCVYGNPPGQPSQCAIFRSADRGETWELLSIIKTDHDLYEGSIAQLQDGRIVFVARAEGDIAWSADGGRTWTVPVTFGIQMVEPGLLTLRDGTLLCLYGGGGVRAMFSTDGGETWVCGSERYGFSVDPSAYGYAKGVELPDGSVFAVYIDNAGVSPEDVGREAVWGIRLRVRPDKSGIDLLPAPGK